MNLETKGNYTICNRGGYHKLRGLSLAIDAERYVWGSETVRHKPLKSNNKELSRKKLFDILHLM